MKKILTVLLFTAALSAQTIHVKYRATPVDTKNFKCEDTISSFVHRTCYDKENKYMLILLRHTWYHYCRMPEEIWEALLDAPSKGRFYNREIRGNFDCRDGGVPEY